MCPLWENEIAVISGRMTGLSILELCNKYYINSQARYLGDSMKRSYGLQ